MTTQKINKLENELKDIEEEEEETLFEKNNFEITNMVSQFINLEKINYIIFPIRIDLHTIRMEQ